MALKEIVFSLVMVVYQLVDVGCEICSNYVEMAGIPARIVSEYRFILVALILTPIAVIHYRRTNPRPKLTWRIVLYSFLCAFCRNLSALIRHSGSTLTSTALGHMSPVFVYLLPVIFRVEKLSIRTRNGKVGITGTLLAFAGSMIITFVHGRVISLWPNKFILDHNAVDLSYQDPLNPKRFFGDQPGTILFLGLINSILLASSTIIEAKMLEKYMYTTGCCTLIWTMGAIQLMVINVSIDRHIYTDNMTTLWPLVLQTIPCMAIVGTVLFKLVEAFYINKKETFLVATYKPVGVILMAILSPLFIGDKLNVGSVVGTIIIIIGVLMVEWAKRENVNNNPSPNLNVAETPEIPMLASIDEV